MELNKLLIIGNLTRDPEMKFLQSGSQVCSMRIAANRKSGGKEEVLFLDVEAWNKTAELCAQYLQKGSQALFDGRLKMETWTATDGQERTKYVLVADRVSFGASPNRDAQGGGGRASSQPAQQNYNTARGYQPGQSYQPTPPIDDDPFSP